MDGPVAHHATPDEMTHPFRPQARALSKKRRPHQVACALLLLTFASVSWGQDDCFNPDLSNDGNVGAADLVMLLSYYDMAWPLDTVVTCPTSVQHQGHDYGVVQIGNQCWFAENCRHLPAVSPATSQESSPHAFVFGYDGTDTDEAMATEAYNTYGGLYNFYAMTEWDLCPTGWHPATDEDWMVMEGFIGVPEAELDEISWRGDNQGEQLKDSVTWNGTDDHEMTFVPGGQTFTNGTFDNEGTSLLIWVATEYSYTKGWYRVLMTGADPIFRSNNITKRVGGYVRCIMD